ncbi:MAG TPA: hypothetical protein VK791_10045 [bacterium]|jgi:hypothetical protein|nr:hypothetical protein [bacterium]
MMKSGFKNLMVLFFAAMAIPAWAGHGTLLSIDRDPALNADLHNLVAAGWIDAPDKKVDQLTNIEVAQLTAQAGNSVPLPAPSLDAGLPPMLSAPGLPSSSPGLPSMTSPMTTNPGVALPNMMMMPGSTPSAADLIAGKSLKQLVDEFKSELAAMGVNTAQIEDRIYALQHNNESLADLQKLYLQRTGTDVTGSSRGYLNEYRGFGTAAQYGPAVYNDAIFGELDLKSVPVPSVLFDARIRLWRTIGFYNQDPIEKNGGTLFDLRWLSLGNYNPYVSVTAGDFLLHYTPLTLWNYEVPVYNFIEPTSFYRNRKNVEEMVSMNYDQDWRLRGFQLFTYPKFEKGSFISSFDAQTMAGPISEQDPFHFGSYYGGGEAAIRFFEDGLEFKTTGLTMWDDPGTVNPAPATTLYTPKAYQIGSISTKIVLSFAKDINITGAAEGADSNYNDNLNTVINSAAATQSIVNDAAFRGVAQINIAGFHLEGKYLDTGSYFYSPGAQTNRWTPSAITPGYFHSDNFWEDEALIGYRDNFLFQDFGGVGRPSFAPYDRMTENILPYGDATPNRQGFITDMTFDIGNHGWLKPQFSAIVQMQEIQPNLVYNTLQTQMLPVDSATNTAAARVFNGFETALTVDFAKAFDLTDHTFKIAGDYKYQDTNLGVAGLPDYTVSSYIASLDFNPPFAGFDTLVLSTSFEFSQSMGGEYTLNGQGNPPSLASYSFFLNSQDLGSYSYQTLNITKTTWAFGFMYPLSKTVEFHGDYFINQYVWTDVPAYSRWEDIWRFSYEARF